MPVIHLIDSNYLSQHSGGGRCGCSSTYNTPIHYSLLYLRNHNLITDYIFSIESNQKPGWENSEFPLNNNYSGLKIDWEGGRCKLFDVEKIEKHSRQSVL